MTFPNTLRLASNDGASADISLFGGQVLSWQTSDGRAGLFLSKLASHGTGAPIRGGIPIVFPQFSDFGPLQKHGFARVQQWTLMDRSRAVEGETARLRMTHTAATTPAWSHDCTLEVAVTVGGCALAVALCVQNTGNSAFQFTSALHTYLAIDDIDAITIEGLGGQPYADTTAAGALGVEQAFNMKVRGEIDRIYRGVAEPVIIREQDRETVVAATGFPEVVIWNPGAIRGAALVDLEPDGYRRMLCVEAAAIQIPIALEPTQVWQGCQTIRTYPSVDKRGDGQ